MTKFTLNTPVRYRDNCHFQYPAKIVFIDEAMEAPLGVRVEFDSGPALVPMYPDGTRDDDGCEPRLELLPETVSRFVNLYAPDKSQGTFRDTLEELEDTRIYSRLGILEVVYENGKVSRQVFHPAPRNAPVAQDGLAI